MLLTDPTCLEDKLPDPIRLDCPIERARALSTALFDESEHSDDAGRLTEKTWRLVRESGLLTAMFPRADGGEDLLDYNRSGDLCRILRLVGAGDLSVARLFEGHVNAVALVHRYGSKQQLAVLAQEARAGRTSAVWNAEGQRPLEALKNNGWDLVGEKTLASGAGLVVVPVVPAKTSGGVVMLMPEMPPGERTDLSRWTPQGMRATATGTVDFSGLHVPASRQVGVAGDYMRQPTFSGGAWRFCAVHLGAAERLVDLYRAQLKGRSRGDDPYQKQRVAHSVTAVVTARQWVTKAAAMTAAPDPDPVSVVAFVNLTRVVTERACLDVLEAVHRGMGLSAFIRPDPVERISRDLSTYLRQPVPDAAMADAAAAVLDSPLSVFDLWSA